MWSNLEKITTKDIIGLYDVFDDSLRGKKLDKNRHREEAVFG